MNMPTSTQSPSRSEIRLSQILDDYLAAVQRGAAFDPSALLAAHPDLAEDLKVCLASLEFLRTASPAARLGSDFGEEGCSSSLLGDFRIIRELGRGGMGVVYEAHQNRLDRRVALKVVLAGRFAPADDLRRFRIEAEAAAQLDHPNIVPIFHVGEHAGLPFFSIKLLEGGSLADRLNTYRNDPRSAAALVATIARAIHHAHLQGILHRDLKPSNILLDEAGQPYASDFGLAKRQGDGGESTCTGAVLGSPPYMAPEQTSGERSAITTATDVYGLGAVLYALLTGGPPFRADSAIETMEQVKTRDPALPRRLNPSVDGDIQAICLKCLEKDPARRYASADMLANDLERWRHGEPIEAVPPSTWYRLRKFGRRNRAMLSTMSVIALVLIAGTSVSLYQAIAARRARSQALTQRDRARKAVDEMYTEVAQKWLSQQPQLELLQREFLLKALDFYQDFARERGSHPDARRGAARAERNAADILGKLGEHHRAESAYRRAVEIQEPLINEFPKVPEYRMELAKSYISLANLLRETGRLAEAERANSRALELREALVVEFPKVPDYRNDLASSYLMCGFGLGERSQFVEAERSVRRAIELRETLVAEFPKVLDYSDALAGIHVNLGVLLFRTGRSEEAERAWRRGIAMKEALPAQFPEVSGAPEYRKSLAHSHSNLGVVLFSMPDRLIEAERAFRRALELRESLVAEFPKVPGYRKDLADSYVNLGGLLRAPGRLAEAEQALRRAIELQEVLVVQSPDNPDYRSRLGASLSNLGQLQKDRGELTSALASFQRAIEHQREALRANPSNPAYREYLRNHYGGMAHVLEKRGDHAGAAQAAEESARTSPNRARDSVFWAEFFVRCQRLAETDSRLSTADRQATVREYARRALTLLKEAVKAGGDDPQALNSLAWFLATCPDSRFRDPARAVELARKAVEMAPKAEATWNTLGVAQYYAGESDKAVESLSRSMKLTSGGSPADWLFLSMAHWQKGDKDKARSWYDKAAEWMGKNRSQDDELRRFHAEAAALLGVTEHPTPTTARKEVNATPSSKP